MLALVASMLGGLGDSALGRSSQLSRRWMRCSCWRMELGSRRGARSAVPRKGPSVKGILQHSVEHALAHEQFAAGLVELSFSWPNMRLKHRRMLLSAGGWPAWCRRGGWAERPTPPPTDSGRNGRRVSRPFSLLQVGQRNGVLKAGITGPAVRKTSETPWPAMCRPAGWDRPERNVMSFRCGSKDSVDLLSLNPCLPQNQCHSAWWITLSRVTPFGKRSVTSASLPEQTPCFQKGYGWR